MHRLEDTLPQLKPKRPYGAYLPKRADKNQPSVVRTLRQMGFMVQHLHEVGSGVFDLIVGKCGLNIFCEIKDGNKSPSARELTLHQKRWHLSWTGMRCVLTGEADCIRFNNQVNSIIRQIRMADIDLYVEGSGEPMYRIGLYP